MKKNILAITLSAVTLLSAGLVFADQHAPGAGYDPSSPEEPNERYLLDLQAYPSHGGYVSNYNGSTFQKDSEVYLYCYPNSGYSFDGWYEGDNKISSVNSFYYKMPGHSVKITAKFKLEDPSGPMEEAYTHTVKISYEPENSGYTNYGTNYFLMREGDTYFIYAYPNGNYKFNGWKVDGKMVSPNDDGTPTNPLRLTMEDKSIDLTASFSYAPNDPGDPMPNSYNRETFELIVDNFYPGNLQGTIEELISDRRFNINRSEIHSMIVAGKMEYPDQNFGYGMTECSSVDLARTSGLTSINYESFYDMGDALTEVILPASLEEIDSRTFYNNSNLSSITSYAPVAPIVYDEFFEGFDYPDGNLASGVVAYVPAASFALYKDAPGWKHLSLKTIESADCRIIVNLPDDAADGRYKGMYIVLENPGSGQTQRYVVNDRLSYVFDNLIMNVPGLNLYYNVYLRNQAGDDIASYMNISLSENLKEFPVDFTDVKKMYDLTLKVLQDDGKNIADEMNIVWKNADGEYVASGVKAVEILEGKVLTAMVTLPDSYGAVYQVPQPVNLVAGENNNEAIIKLSTYPKAVVSGVMTNAQTGKPLSGGYVSVEQTIANKYRHTATGVSDKDGKYSLEYVSHNAVKGKVTARAEGCVNQVDSVGDFSAWLKSKDYSMKPISGAVVSVALTWMAPGENKGAEYKDYSNIDFSLFNATSNKDVENFSNQAPLLVIPDEVSKGDKVIVTVSSRSGLFESVSGEAVMDGDNKSEVTLNIKEHGKITSSFGSTEASNVSAILYDGEGKLVKHKLYDSKKAVNFSNLKEGRYTLVAFADSPYFTGFASLADLQNFKGFDKDEDYLLQNVTVSDAGIATVSFAAVPVFDESQFYKVDPAHTQLKVNKTSVTASNYVTLSTRFQFLPEYQGWAENVKLVYEFPEHATYVKNSVVNGDETGNLTQESENRYTLENVTPGTNIRFCLMPEKGGNYYPTASLEFDYKGTHYTQPLGAFYFQGVDFKLYVPKKTCHESIWARGVATNGSDVTIFVNGAPLSSAKASGNGEWLAEVPLMDPENHPIQQIYGEIASASKGTFPTESAIVEYDPCFPELDYVRMINNGSVVDFFHGKAKTSAKSYSYVPERGMFTLNAKFLENNDNIETLNFHILCSDGSEREIDAVYSQNKGLWIAALDFPDSFRLPVNVTVDYTYKKCDDSLSSNFDMDYVAPNVEPIIDPSGFVYEANEDNRVEGATVTVFYREAVEDQFETTWQSVKWDASEYGQENPLTTDKEGLYGWDVPAGEWQVKYEKKGYETAFSKWLQVPPPQLEVNVGLIRNDAPYVKEARAYDAGKGIEIIFDHFMDLKSLEGNIYILKEDADPEADDSKVFGSISAEAKKSENAENSSYVNTVRFVPEEPIASTTDHVYLIVDRKAKSYSGIEMSGPFAQSIPIEKEITGLAADEENITVEEGQVLKVIISATPADAAVGKTLLVSNQSSYIVEFEDSDNSLKYDKDGNLMLTLDEKGQAALNLAGVMVGQSQLDLAVTGSNVTGKALVDVKPEVLLIAKPVASLPHQSEVYRGVLAELSSKYANGIIYYTLDGSDPTPENGQIYKDPIKVNENMTLKAIVVANGKVSEIAVFDYTLKNGLMELSINEGWSWISHNMESHVPVEKILNGDITRMLSQTEEVIKDEKYGYVGTLKTLAPHNSYKVQSAKSGKISLKDVAFNPNQPLDIAQGWNWIGYPVDQTMDLDEAFIDGSCEDGDIIETLAGGFAEFKDGQWVGNLVKHGMKPGVGYLYYSVSGKKIQYNTSIVSTAAARMAVQPRSAAPWAADKYLYASLMPIVADIIKSDGTIADEGEFSIGAFCGSECRGIGEYVDGYLFLSVHGNPGDEISFRILGTEEDAQELVLDQTLQFTENPVGSLNYPYQFNAERTGIKSISTNNEISVSVINRMLNVAGNDVDYVAVYDINGNKILATANAQSPIALDIVNVGVHIVAVRSNGNWSYHKVMIK